MSRQLGIFGRNARMAGPLGQTTDDDPYGPFAWMKYSKTTAQIQSAMNDWLVKNKYCPLSVDGVLGPKTCQAMKTVPGFTPVSTCQKYGTLTKQPCAGTSTTEPLPWGVYSDQTKTQQAAANNSLKAQGLCPVPVTGILDAVTCGGFIAAGLTAPSTCKDWKTPSGGDPMSWPTCKRELPPETPEVTAPPPSAAPPASSVAPSAPLPSAAGGKLSTASALMVGGLLAAVAAGGYYVAKKKGWLR
jgi:hypothetical protein